MPEDPRAVEAVRRVAQPLAGARGDYDALLRHVGEAGIVLLGEASHGTHDFYAARAESTRRLIEEKGFGAVVEADWPDAYRVDRYVRGRGETRKRWMPWPASSASRPGCGATRTSHYFHVRVLDQFDAVIHFDESRAVEPLERTAPAVPEELAETFPSGV